MLEFIYKDSNNNSEFINQIIEYIDNMIGNIYWIISDLDIISNDREDFITNKPMFSEKVFNFENVVEREHGNAETMIDYSTGKPMTAHTTNLVPFTYVSKEIGTLRSGGILADIAPTILTKMELDIPSEMSGKSLI